MDLLAPTVFWDLLREGFRRAGSNLQHSGILNQIINHSVMNRGVGNNGHNALNDIFNSQQELASFIRENTNSHNFVGDRFNAKGEFIGKFFRKNGVEWRTNKLGKFDTAYKAGVDRGATPYSGAKKAWNIVNKVNCAVAILSLAWNCYQLYEVTKLEDTTEEIRIAANNLKRALETLMRRIRNMSNDQILAHREELQGQAEDYQGRVENLLEQIRSTKDGVRSNRNRSVGSTLTSATNTVVGVCGVVVDPLDPFAWGGLVAGVAGTIIGAVAWHKANELLDHLEELETDMKKLQENLHWAFVELEFGEGIVLGRGPDVGFYRVARNQYERVILDRRYAWDAAQQ